MAKDVDRRNRIIVAARSEFAAHGYAGARVARIAQTAGVNKQLVFYYFGSKTGLHAAAVETDPSAVYPDVAPQGAQPLVDLRQALSHLADSFAKRPELVAFLVDRQGDLSGTSTQAGSLVEAAAGRIEAILSQGQGHGYFRDDADTKMLSQQALALIVAYFAIPALSQPAGPPTADWVDGVADLLARAAAW